MIATDSLLFYTAWALSENMTCLIIMRFENVFLKYTFLNIHLIAHFTLDCVSKASATTAVVFV